MALGPAVAAGAFPAPRVPDVGRKLLGVFMRCANVFRVGETGQNPYQEIGGVAAVVGAGCVYVCVGVGGGLSTKG